MRARVQLLRGSIFSALGLVELACGGSTSAGERPGGTAAAGGASAAGAAGRPSSSGGGRGGAGGAGGAAETAGGNVAEPAPMPKFPCLGSVPWGGSHAGYEQCGEAGPVHRPAVGECMSLLPRAAVQVGEFDECKSDAECTDKPHGFCAHSCRYGCVTDAECASGEICLCGDLIGRCVEATCTVDADCGAGFVCQRYEGLTDIEGGKARCDIERFACQTADDSCGSDVDCGEHALCNADSGRFECVGLASHCSIIGRPFWVLGAARTASLKADAAWSTASVLFDASEYSPELRALAAQAWARVGLMEHASVAAFARFALQLLGLGAPREAIEETARAMADEVRHATLAFAVASQFDGRSYGPGPLDVTDCMPSGTLAEVTRLAFLEGCIGETIAALEAREAAEHALPAALKQVLHHVADDETRHAELAWRFVRWALGQKPELVLVVREELAGAVRQGGSMSAAASEQETRLLELGVVPDGLRDEIRSATLQHVITPCLAALEAALGSKQYSSRNEQLRC